MTNDNGNHYDAIIVGARCAGSPLAILLHRQGMKVLLLDRDEFPSDTISTNMIFPNTLARLDDLGVLDVLAEQHELNYVSYRILCLGHDINTPFTSIGGFDHSLAPRRIVLDKAMIDTATRAGVETRFGEAVSGLIGSGTEDDPVRGVTLENGEQLTARWVIGADGRASIVARELGLEKTREQAGEYSLLFGYWRGIPGRECTVHIEYDYALFSYPVEDDLHLLTMSGDAEYSRGSHAERLERYMETVRRFPDTVSPDVLDSAELATDLFVAPESLMRGYYRQSNGPGWALVGDAGHFKHPATAQGIGDAVEQAHYVARALAGEDEALEGYSDWRSSRSDEHYDWSYSWGRFPTKETTEPVFRGIAADPEASQDLIDSFSRRVEPSEVFTKDRLARWFAPAG